LKVARRKVWAAFIFLRHTEASLLQLIRQVKVLKEVFLPKPEAGLNMHLELSKATMIRWVEVQISLNYPLSLQ
jgi:hypothetical protein